MCKHARSCRDERAEDGLRQTGLMAEPDRAALAVLAARSLRQSLLALGLPGARARAAWAALVVHASQAVPVGQLVGGSPGIAGRWPLLAVTGW